MFKVAGFIVLIDSSGAANGVVSRSTRLALPTPQIGVNSSNQAFCRRARRSSRTLSLIQHLDLHHIPGPSLHTSPGATIEARNLIPYNESNSLDSPAKTDPKLKYGESGCTLLKLGVRKCCSVYTSLSHGAKSGSVGEGLNMELGLLLALPLGVTEAVCFKRRSLSRSCEARGR